MARYILFCTLCGTLCKVFGYGLNRADLTVQEAEAA